MTAPAFGPAEVPRDYWGRPKVKLPDSEAMATYTRVTTYVECLEDRVPLSKWEQRKVAEGLAGRPDLLLKANSLGPEPPRHEAEAFKQWKAQMDGLCKEALEAARSKARATIGTALHKLTERLDRGEDVGAVPEQYIPHLAAYQEATASLHPVYIEQFCVLDKLKLGGTPDRISHVDGEEGLFVCDVKTGSLDFGVGKMAMQLGVYAYSTPYDPATGERRPWPEPINRERGLIIGLNADTGLVELLWIDIAAGWAAVDLATQVRAWRARKALLKPARPTIVVTPLQPTQEAALLVAIDSASSVDELTALWRAAGAGWTDEHTARAAARKAQLRRAA